MATKTRAVLGRVQQCFFSSAKRSVFSSSSPVLHDPPPPISLASSRKMENCNGVAVEDPPPEPFIISLSSSVNLSSVSTQGASIITSGGLIATPTDTVYGIAGDAQNDAAISAIYKIKGRHCDKPVAICVSEISQVYQWGKVLVPRSLLEDLLPGPVTLVFERQPLLNPGLNPNTNLIGIRIPDHQFIRKLAEAHGGPVALTSANFSNCPSTLEVEEFKEMWPYLQAIFDGGRLSSCEKSEAAARAGSTVIDLSSQGHFKIIREGTAYSECVEVLNTSLYDKIHLPSIHPLRLPVPQYAFSSNRLIQRGAKIYYLILHSTELIAKLKADAQPQPVSKNRQYFQKEFIRRIERRGKEETLSIMGTDSE
ncbi:unnamed protein product [Orchesella dallaii]|uniref:Threonylcarbamoyl-AMP synthase n=1 Tax=Orchesella dallaii TaxID=48710 RepID=A0ABP1Q3Y4_9HEXA